MRTVVLYNFMFPVLVNSLLSPEDEFQASFQPYRRQFWNPAYIEPSVSNIEKYQTPTPAYIPKTYSIPDSYYEPRSLFIALKPRNSKTTNKLSSKSVTKDGVQYHPMVKRIKLKRKQPYKSHKDEDDGHIHFTKKNSDKKRRRTKLTSKNLKDNRGFSSHYKKSSKDSTAPYGKKTEFNTNLPQVSTKKEKYKYSYDIYNPNRRRKKINKKTKKIHIKGPKQKYGRNLLNNYNSVDNSYVPPPFPAYLVEIPYESESAYGEDHYLKRETSKNRHYFQLENPEEKKHFIGYRSTDYDIQRTKTETNAKEIYNEHPHDNIWKDRNEEYIQNAHSKILPNYYPITESSYTSYSTHNLPDHSSSNSDITEKHPLPSSRMTYPSKNSVLKDQMTHHHPKNQVYYPPTIESSTIDSKRSIFPSFHEVIAKQKQEKLHKKNTKVHREHYEIPEKDKLELSGTKTYETISYESSDESLEKSKNPSELHTTFSCFDKPVGYYADQTTGCKVFHMCLYGGRRNSFHCPGGTIFHQQILTCDHWQNVDCKSASEFYKINSKLYEKKDERYNELEEITNDILSDYTPDRSRLYDDVITVITSPGYDLPVTYRRFHNRA